MVTDASAILLVGSRRKNRQDLTYWSSSCGWWCACARLQHFVSDDRNANVRIDLHASNGGVLTIIAIIIVVIIDARIITPEEIFFFYAFVGSIISFVRCAPTRQHSQHSFGHHHHHHSVLERRIVLFYYIWELRVWAVWCRLYGRMQTAFRRRCVEYWLILLLHLNRSAKFKGIFLLSYFLKEQKNKTILKWKSEREWEREKERGDEKKHETNNEFKRADCIRSIFFVFL